MCAHSVVSRQARRSPREDIEDRVLRSDRERARRRERNPTERADASGDYKVLDDNSNTIETDTTGAYGHGLLVARSSSRAEKHHHYTAEVWRCD